METQKCFWYNVTKKAWRGNVYAKKWQRNYGPKPIEKFAAEEQSMISTGILQLVVH